MEKKKEQEHRGIQTLVFLICAAKIWCSFRSVINCNSSNCVTRLSMLMKYECEPCLSFKSTYIQRYFVPRIHWLNNCLHSISGVPIFYCVTNYKEKKSFFIVLNIFTWRIFYLRSSYLFPPSTSLLFGSEYPFYQVHKTNRPLQEWNCKS